MARKFAVGIIAGMALLPFISFAAAQPASIITRPGVTTTPIKYYFDLSSALSEGVNQSVKVTVSASNAEKTAVRFESVKLFAEGGAAIGNNVASKTDALSSTPYAFVFQNFGVSAEDLKKVAGVQITFLDLGGDNPTGKVTVQSVSVSVEKNIGEACVIADPFVLPKPIVTINQIQSARPLIQPGTHGTGDATTGGGNTIGPIFPTSATGDGNSGGNAVWASPENALTDNNVRAQASGTIEAFTANLDVYGFTNLANIPSTATINGIVVEVDRSVSSGSGVEDYQAILINAGAGISASRPNSGAWPVGDAVATYGTPTNRVDYWGGNFTATDIASPTFGFRLVASFTSPVDIMVDYVKMTVYYTPLGGSVYDSFMDLIRSLFRVKYNN